MSLTKAQIVEQIHKGSESLSKDQAEQLVETFLEMMKSSLAGRNDVLLSGFGKFSVKEKKARRGRNPQTGEDLMLEARRVVTFKPSGLLREKVQD